MKRNNTIKKKHNDFSAINYDAVTPNVPLIKFYHLGYFKNA